MSMLKARILVCGAGAAVTGLLILLALVKRNEKTGRKVLFATLIFSLFTAVYATLTYGQVTFHSDTATATLLAQSVIKNRSLFPKTWNFVNGDLWFLSLHLTTLLPSLLLKNQALAREIGSVLLYVPAVLSMVYFCRRIFKNDSWLLAVPMYLVHLYGCADHTLYQASYAEMMLWMCLLVGFFYEVYRRYEEKHSVKYLLLFAVFTALVSLQGARFLAELTVPLWCTCLILIYLKIREQKDEDIDWKGSAKKALYCSAVVLIPALLGAGLYVLLTRADLFAMVNSDDNALVFVPTMTAAVKNFAETVGNFFLNFAYREKSHFPSLSAIQTMSAMVMCVLVCFVVPFLQAKKLKEEDGAVRFFFCYAMVHNALMLFIVIFFGKTTPRYILTSIFTLILISARYIWCYWLKLPNFRKYLWLALFVLATGIQCLGFLRDTATWKDDLYREKAVVREIEDRGITKAYGTYWRAYKYEVLSDLKIRFGGVTVYQKSGIKPYYWLVDDSAFEKTDGRTCLVLADWEYKDFETALKTYLGEPEEFVSVGDYRILFFDHDIITDMNDTASWKHKNEDVVSPKG